MLMQYILRFHKKRIAAAAIGGCCLWLSSGPAAAYEVLGVGTDALIGGDLTDMDDDGDPEFDDGYDAIFDASDEPGFGGGESAFNVFDNLLGPGNDKWCCGIAGGIDEDNPQWVSAEFPVPYRLTNFTVSSANDTPDRDPIHWSIQGSNDGQNYTDIYTYDDDFAPWVDRLEVIEWTAGDDFPVQTESYLEFRLATFNTVLNPDGAYFQIGEIEYFGNATGETPPIYIGGQGTIGVQSYEGDQSNEMYGPVEEGVSGWSGRIVTFEESGLTLDNHTIAEEALEDFDGVTATEAYTVVDMAGGGGSFPVNLAYPDGSTGGDDFTVQVVSEVTIPAGTWTIGFGSDDGGQITIPGVEFELASDPNDSFDDDQIRFEGNRGHGWTVGSFELSEPLETTITASFHERGGGDSFEIAVIEDEVIEGANPANGWELLADGTLGWSVKTTAAPLVSADLSAEVRSNRVWQFDVDGDTGMSDQMVVENPDANIFTTILNVDGVEFEIASAGAVTSGEAFTIIDADQVMGTPIITSLDPAQTWVFDADTGRLCLDSCPGVGGAGDYNGNGLLDAGDLDLHASVGIANQDLAYDANGDGLVNVDDRVVWTNELKNTWMGDSDLNGVFDTADFVLVFGEGKYETGGAATWGQGDWDGNMLFDSGDFVAAFGNGGYEMGERAGGPNPVTAAVPEPSSLVLALLSLVGLVGFGRRRNG